jgi:hypothetical protein
VRESSHVDAAVGRIDELLEQLGDADRPVRDMAEEVIQLLMQLYGAALTRIIETIGREAAAPLAEDRLVSSLLVLHGLHPVPAKKRIEDALSRVQRRLEGARLIVQEVRDGAARVRVDLGNGPRPPATLAVLIERTISDCAPEIGRVEIEGLPQTAVPLIQIAPAAPVR